MEPCRREHQRAAPPWPSGTQTMIGRRKTPAAIAAGEAASLRRRVEALEREHAAAERELEAARVERWNALIAGHDGGAIEAARRRAAAAEDRAAELADALEAARRRLEAAEAH